MLALDGITAGYGRSEVLHGVDLVLPEGSTVALLGANGAGKSTLLKVAAGLLQAKAGNVRFHGKLINGLPTWRRSRLGLCLIPEGRGIFHQCSVAENLAMCVAGRNVARAIRLAAEAFPILGDRLSQEAGTLSGGQQQMLAVARALVTDPSVIMVDELSSGLAPVIVDELFEVIKMLRSKGHSLLLVEQYVHRALEVADYVYVLHKGQVVFVGEPQQCHDQQIFEQYLGSVA